MSIGRKLIKNTVYNFIGKAFGLITTLILTPYIIKKIGAEAFGLWAIIFVIGGYLCLFDFGIKWAYIKYIAEYNKKNDTLAINRIVNTGLSFYFVLFIIIFIIALILRAPILSFFKISETMKYEFYTIYNYAILSFIILNIFSVFKCIPIGLQRMDMSNKINIFIGVLNFVGTVIFLSIGFKLKGLVINNLIVNVVMIIISIFVSFKLLKNLKIGFHYINRAELKKIVFFGFKNQIASLHELVSFQTDKFIVGNHLSMVYVSFYEVGTRLLRQVRFITSLFISAVVPAVSELKIENDMNKITRLYTVANKYIVTVIIPLLVLLNIFAYDIINIWVGKKFLESVNVFYLLSTGYFFNCLCATAYVILIGIGRPDINMKFGIFDAVLNLVLSITFIILFKFKGILIGTSLALTISSIYLLIMSHKLLKIDFFKFWKNIVTLPFLSAACSAFLIIILNKAIITNSGKLIMLIGLLSKSVLFLGIYVSLLFLFKYYDIKEIKEIRNYVK